MAGLVLVEPLHTLANAAAVKLKTIFHNDHAPTDIPFTS